MFINKNTFFTGLIAGLLSPATMSAAINQQRRTETSTPSISIPQLNEESQMRSDFENVGVDLRDAIKKYDPQIILLHSPQK